MSRETRLSPEALARRDHRTWLEDYGRWRAEHRQALAMLARVQTIILERESSLERQATAVQLHEWESQDFDLIGCGPGSPDPEQELARHDEYAKKHEAERDLYERTKREHVSIVGEVKRLLQLCQGTR